MDSFKKSMKRKSSVKSVQSTAVRRSQRSSLLSLISKGDALRPDGRESLNRMRYEEDFQNLVKAVQSLNNCHEAVVAELELQLQKSSNSSGISGMGHTNPNSFFDRQTSDEVTEMKFQPKSKPRTETAQKSAPGDHRFQKSARENSQSTVHDPPPPLVHDAPPNPQHPHAQIADSDSDVSDLEDEEVHDTGADTFKSNEQVQAWVAPEKSQSKPDTGEDMDHVASLSQTQDKRRMSTMSHMGAGRGHSIMPVPQIRDSQVEDLVVWEFWEDIAALGEARTRTTVNRPTLNRQTTQKSLLTRGATKHFKQMMTKNHLSTEESAPPLMKFAQALVQSPDSLKRLIWIVFGFVLICIDLVTVPLSAFPIDTLEFDMVFSVVSTVYWSMDFAMSFLVGFHSGDSIEMRPQKTAANYASTWMIIDIAMLTVDVVQLAMLEDEAADNATVGRAIRGVRLSRYLRIIRLIRLFRVVKVQFLVKSLHLVSQLLGSSEYVTMSFSLAQNLTALLLVNHMFACTFYYLGSLSEDRGSHSWIRESQLDQEGVSWEYAYVTSLHWSLTQFTPASVDIHPTNLPERLFAVVVILFAMITFSSFVSSITNLMTHLRSLRNVESKMFSKLEHFLQHHSVSFSTSYRIRGYLERLVIEQRTSPVEKDVELLSLLSEPLLIELHHELHSPVITAHPFLKEYQALNLIAAQKICHSAVQELFFSKSDTVFTPGEFAKQMFFPVKGSLEYKPETVDDIIDNVTTGQWIAEMSLWCHWNYRGILRAKVECNLFLLDAYSFHQVIMHSKQGQWEAANYALERVAKLNEVGRSLWTDIDDCM